jgi:hypothetical protein
VVLSVGGGVSNLRKSVGAEPYVECVFENDLAELDAAETLVAAEANERTLIAAEVRRLELAAHWADLHSGEAVVESRLPGIEHPVRLGGDGTATVGDFAPAELGCVLRISDGSASRLIADALDLRHRLPKIWLAAQAGQVPAGGVTCSSVKRLALKRRFGRGRVLERRHRRGGASVCASPRVRCSHSFCGGRLGPLPVDAIGPG